MSNSDDNRTWRWIADHRWIVAGAILYIVCLGYVLTTIGFGEDRAVRQFIAQAPAQASREPIPALPTMRTVQWPDNAMRRDPFQPVVRESTKVRQKP